MPCGIDWDAVELVVFDVDGTLYDQQQLRAVMAIELAREVVRRRSLSLAMTLRAFRQCREQLGNAAPDDFRDLQYILVAERTGQSVEHIRALVDEWIERRPLAHLATARCDGIQELFAALSAAGRTIAVFSDYPAQEKLTALGLAPDFVVSALDDDVARLKPDPTGLRKALSIAGVTPERALMIGDRFDRDGLAARSAGVPALIRSRWSKPPHATFRSYRDAVFLPILRKKKIATNARLQ